MNHRAFKLSHLVALLLSCVSCAIGPLTHVGVAALLPPEYDVVILNGRTAQFKPSALQACAGAPLCLQPVWLYLRVS